MSQADDHGGERSRAPRAGEWDATQSFDADSLDISPREIRDRIGAEDSEAAEQVLRELAEGPARVEEELEETQNRISEAERRRLQKARLEHVAQVDGKEREVFQDNFAEQRRLEEIEEAELESEFAATLHGKLWHWRGSRWLFDRRTRRLEMLILSGLFIAVLGVAYSLVHSGRQLTTPEEPAESEDVTSTGEVLLERMEETGELVSAFFRAKSMEEVLPMIRHPEALRPIMEKWYADNPHPHHPDIEFGDRAGVKGDPENPRFFTHYVRFENDFRDRLIPVEVTDEGDKIDWETAVGYQSIDWDEYMEKRPPEPVNFRVIVEQDERNEYYNYEFQDDTEWACYQLRHPDLESPLFGYVKRYSALDRELLQALRRGPEYFILNLRYSENAQSGDVVHIDEIVQKWWVWRDEPGERHFDDKDI